MTDSAPRPTLAREMRRIADQFKERPVYLKEVVASSQGRGYDLLLILLALPFTTPIPLPLLSTPFGMIISFAGLRMALGRKPWWPSWLLEKELPPRFFPAMFRATSRIVAGIEYMVKPRLQFLHNAALFQRLAGALIALSGLFLLLPLPVPFSNFFPALAIVLLAAGALEKDGLFFLAGTFVFCVAAGYLLLLWLGGTAAVKRIF